MPNPVLAVAGIKGVSSIAQGASAGKAAKRAAAAQAQAQQQALELQRQMFERQVELNEPFRQAGVTSTNELMRQMGLGGDAASQGYGNLLRDFSAADFEVDPGYQFRLAEGNKALDRMAAARGGLLSGGAIKAGQRYGQDLASQEYQNAYNRYNTNRNMRYNYLTGQQGVGQQAAQTVGGAAQNYASQGGQNIVGAGAARASGYIGSAAARNAMIGSLGNIGESLVGNWNPYASPAQGAAIKSGWERWSDPMSGMSVPSPYNPGY